MQLRLLVSVRNLSLGMSPKKRAATSSSGSPDPSPSKSSKVGSTGLRFCSWNINGVRAWSGKGSVEWLESQDFDIIGLQETRCREAQIPAKAKFAGYVHQYWLSADKDGYAGTAILSKTKPISVAYGMGIKKHDTEGRLITAEYKDFYFLTAYVPNSGRGLPRLEYRQTWNSDFLKYIADLDKEKPVIYCGDLNVAHEEIDIANPKSNRKNAGFTAEERADMNTLIGAGFIDTFRHLYPDADKRYTFWSNLGGARAKNVGWRLDYFLVSERLLPSLEDSVIHEKVMGSDHCPVELKMNKF